MAAQRSQDPTQDQQIKADIAENSKANPGMTCRWKRCMYRSERVADVERHEIACKEAPRSVSESAYKLAWGCPYSGCEHRGAQMSHIKTHYRSQHIASGERGIFGCVACPGARYADKTQASRHYKACPAAQEAVAARQLKSGITGKENDVAIPEILNWDYKLPAVQGRPSKKANAAGRRRGSANSAGSGASSAGNQLSQSPPSANGLGVSGGEGSAQQTANLPPGFDQVLAYNQRTLLESNSPAGQQGQEGTFYSPSDTSEGMTPELLALVDEAIENGVFDDPGNFEPPQQAQADSELSVDQSMAEPTGWASSAAQGSAPAESDPYWNYDPNVLRESYVMVEPDVAGGDWLLVRGHSREGPSIF